MKRAVGDVAIIGAGHNGLVAAYYLARAGLRPIVLERRAIVGGACVTEEFAPGYRASTGAYVLSMLRPAIWRDLGLARRGVEVDDAGPTLNLFPDGTQLLLDDDSETAAEQIRSLSAADARAFVSVERQLARLAALMVPIFDMTPPTMTQFRTRDLGTIARLTRQVLRSRRDISEALYLMTSSVHHYLGERFESPHVRTALGWHAINDSLAGPSTGGTAFVLLHDHVSSEPNAGMRRWGFVRGGMGRVTQAIAEAAHEAGAVIEVDAPVARINTSHDRGVVRTSGVTLGDGRQLDVQVVISGADPKTTLLTLCDEPDLPGEFRTSVKAIRSDGSSIKINLALEALPHVRGLSSDGAGPQPYHRGIMEIGPTLEVLDLQQAEARAGRAAEGSHIEMCCPSVHDPSLAPEGHHIATIDVNSQPYTLADGRWDEQRERVADRVLAEIDQYLPDLSAKVLHRQVLTPLDLERVLGMSGGHALHGEMAPDQLFVNRPVRGWADYRTPIEGLYLCGAGTHPGGGVSGANGRNCAREVLRDLRRRSRRWLN